jgi:N-methylhydantoinase A
VRDVVERTIVNPTPEDIVRIRREAADRVIAAGAAPDRVEVSIEIDTQHNRVRATASGATAMVEAAAALSLRVERSGDQARVIDEREVVRLVLYRADVAETTVARLEGRLARAIEDATRFGDVGRALPDVYLVHGARIADLRGLASAAQARALAQEEIAGCNPGDSVTILTVSRSA